MNLNSDGVRMMELTARTCAETHPYNTFGWGNLKSLKEVPSAANFNVHDALRRFHSSYYRPEKIKVCVLGKKKSWVRC